ncbi:MAG: hypothetical protein ABIE22_00285 [archaeon]
MRLKKGIFCLILLILTISLVYADDINLEITKTPVSEVVITELTEPAEFNFKIKNLGPPDNFEIYALLDIDFSPRGTFKISGGEEVEMVVRVYPGETFRKNSGPLSFVYKIRGQNSGIQDDILKIEIAKIEDAIEIGTYDISPDSNTATVYVLNKVKHNFTSIDLDFTSAFFSASEQFSLDPLSIKEFTVPIDREKTRTLVAGDYILTGAIELEEIKKSLEGNIRFVEKSGITTSEDSAGFIIAQTIVTKTNEGNLPAVAELTFTKNAISRLFTSFSVEPDRVERKGFLVIYSWQSELRPGENMKVKITTNWLYPLILLLAVIIIVILAYIYTSSTLVLKKKLTFVKTKSGDLALKVTIVARARSFVEKISLVDKIPPLVKIHERFGSIEPDKIDHKHNRLEWNIDSLQAGEERIFTYVVYSKIGVVGRFELPPTVAVYEKNGKIHETESNKAFFVAEQQSEK